MYGKLHSACLHGIDGVVIQVEVDLANGLPQTSIIGLPDSSIRESIERVRRRLKLRFYLSLKTGNRQSSTGGSPKRGLFLRFGDRCRHIADKRTMDLFECRANIDPRRTRTGWYAQTHHRGATNGGASEKEGYAGVLLPSENAPEVALIGDRSLWAQALE